VCGRHTTDNRHLVVSPLRPFIRGVLGSRASVRALRWPRLGLVGRIMSPFSAFLSRRRRHGQGKREREVCRGARARATPPRRRGYRPTVRGCNPSRGCPGAWRPCWKQPFGTPLGGGLDLPPPQHPLRRDPFRWAHWPGMMTGPRWGLPGAEFRNRFRPGKPPTNRRGHSFANGEETPCWEEFLCSL
jgi:hypothetical protein